MDTWVLQFDPMKTTPQSSMAPASDAIQITEKDGQTTVHLQDKKELHPSDLSWTPGDFQGKIEGKTVVLSGKAPLWFYAHWAYRLVNAGAKEVRALQAPDREFLVYRKGPSDQVAPKPRWVNELTENGHCRLFLAPDKEEEHSVLEKGLFLLPRGVEVLTLTGRGANWMYAYLGALAANSGVKKVFYDAPKESGLISIGADETGWIMPRPRQQAEPGFVVGILGDPNSGKSMFANFLSGLVAREIPLSWKYDGDAASPTSNWFVEALRQGHESAAKAIREKQKREWSPALEERVASELRNLKQNIDLVLADLPGGNHKADPPKRVPEGREVILREVDAFIILGREGKPNIIPEWRKELKKHGLEGRIIAEIQSAKPDLPLTLSLEQRDGLLVGTATGLDRSQDLFKCVREINAGENLLVRHLRAWKVARAARAATTCSFLTKSGGTCYGAAVLTRQGGLFRSGQYSSFNHSTNIHAEQGALLLATMAGEPDVLVLALAKSKGADPARPCGVCRQVMIEHAQRTGRDFDVAMIDGATEGYEICKVSSLLPLAWSKESARIEPPIRTAPTGPFSLDPNASLQVGDQVVWPHDGRKFLGVVWEPFVDKGRREIFIKLKYEEKAAGQWKKIPHSFSEPFLYEQFLARSVSLSRTRFGGAVVSVSPCEIEGRYPLQAAGTRVPGGLEEIFCEAGIPAEALRCTGSFATGMNQAASDLDLVCTIETLQIGGLREALIRRVKDGTISIPPASRTWKLLASIFPGGQAGILGERRFCETFEIAGQPIVLIFNKPQDNGILLGPNAGQPLRQAMSGVVESADGCAYKRSRFILAGPAGDRTHVISYIKTGNLVKEGDRVAVRGWLVPKASKDGEDILLQISAATDHIIWQGM